MKWTEKLKRDHSPPTEGKFEKFLALIRLPAVDA